MNAVEIEAAVSDLALQPFHPEEFPYQFLAAFGNKETTLTRLRKGATTTSDVPRAVLQRNHIHLASCDPGQVPATLLALRQSPLHPRHRRRNPRSRRPHHRRPALHRLPQPRRSLLLLPPPRRHLHHQGDQRQPHRYPRHRPSQQALHRTPPPQPRMGHRRPPP